MACALTLLAAGARPALAEPGQKVEAMFERIALEAKQLARSEYVPPAEPNVPESLASLSYDQYRGIRFRQDEALWREQGLFQVELFHPGFLYTQPVRIRTIAAGEVSDVAFARKLFQYDTRPGLAPDESLPKDLGFAGFRVHYPLNQPQYADEVIAFLGASYFRMVGRGQQYGASARGLAVNTALPRGEEFPRFSEFWLVQPDPGQRTLTLYALLESRSVTGAYRFRLDPGKRTRVDVRARLFARADIERLGLAPLTSMFRSGENSSVAVDDFRGEVHDSDGLLVHGGGDAWTWRPLINPESLRVNAFQLENPRGFGLLQRDRDFDHYLDLKSRFEQRPGLWMEPRGEGWGKGAVQLVEIPTDTETNDNIAAFWVPADPLEAGESLDLRYRLSTLGGSPPGHDLARAIRTRTGRGGVPGTERPPADRQRRIAIDFTGGDLSGLSDRQPVTGVVEVTDGEVADVRTEALPGGRGWRLTFQVRPRGDGTVNLSAHLELHGEPLSERWDYVWYRDGAE